MLNIMQKLLIIFLLSLAVVNRTLAYSLNNFKYKVSPSFLCIQFYKPFEP